MKTIGIMGALVQEIAGVAAALQETRVEEYGGVRYTIGMRGSLQVVACCAGMGKANAAATTQVLVTRYAAQAILFSGIAGNTSSEIGLGDMVLGRELVYHDAENAMLAQSAPGVATYMADETLLRVVESACRAAGSRYIVGRIATGDQFIGDPAVKAGIVARCAPDCVEMEGAAVGQIAMRNGVPFVVLRAMSDNSDEGVAELNARAFEVDEYAKNASRVLVAALDILQEEPGL